jgi:hypothetical protein
MEETRGSGAISQKPLKLTVSVQFSLYTRVAITYDQLRYAATRDDRGGPAANTHKGRTDLKKENYGN